MRILIFLLWSQIALAASFNATVETNAVSFGQSFDLKLNLDGAKATRPIDLSALAKDFTIYHQQQYSTYSSVNGSVKAETGWQVTLMPRNSGEFLIPAISLQTDHGLLNTQPINITVSQGTGGDKGIKEGLGISLVSTVNKIKTYVSEPVIYTLKIISYKPIANIVLDDIKSNDAIIEKIGEPSQYDQIHGGVRAHIIEIKYAITALKAGKISIAPATMTGEIQVPSQQMARSQRFGMFNNLFMDNMFELKPFSLKSETINIEIAPAAVKTSDWLPLHNLSVSQTWDGAQSVKVGETITRKVKMVARGGFAKQLPSVKDSMQLQKVKTYANKPTFTNSFDQNAGTIVGTKEEEFSLVPQSEGTITFPEIKITWWNLKTNKLETSTLPAKTFNVVGVANNGAQNITMDYSAEEPQQVVAPATTSSKQQTVLYAIIGVLIGMLLTLGAVLAFVLFKRRTGKKCVVITKPTEKDIVVNSPDDLRLYMLKYAKRHWHAPQDITLNRLGDTLTNNNFNYDIAIYSTLSQNLNAAIYADVDVGLELLLAQWEDFKKSVVKNNKNKIEQDATSEGYSSLNPT